MHCNSALRTCPGGGRPMGVTLAENRAAVAARSHRVCAAIRWFRNACGILHAPASCTNLLVDLHH